MRIIIENILLFLAPAALYFGYMLLLRRSGQSPREVVDQAPLVTLFVAGVLLIAAVLFVFGVRGAEDEGRAGQAYQPSVYKDGKLIPGTVK